MAAVLGLRSLRHHLTPMAPYSPLEALIRLRALYVSTHNEQIPTDDDLRDFATSPHEWAEQIIRHGGWSFSAAEACVRSVRILRKRALQQLDT